jgi:hypothetical protein
VRNLLKPASELAEDSLKDYKEPTLLPFGARLKKLHDNKDNN